MALKASPDRGTTGRTRGIIMAAVLLVAVAFFAWLFNTLQPGTWHYYTDDVSMKRLARDSEPRFVAWEKASALRTSLLPSVDCLQPAISPDGARMVFTRESSPGNQDLFMARWDGAVWGNPEPIRALNSKFNEIGPSFSDDGKFLFFSTDRPGGLGGYDVWVARWDGSEFAWPQPLTLMVNSKFDEICARSSANDARLYFSSNRPGKSLTKEDEALPDKELRKKWAGTDWDVYSADRIPVGVTNRAVERAMSILYSLRRNALTDETVMEKLGGNRKTESAVDRGLAYLAKSQETNGCWVSGGRHHEVAATALALVTFLGRGERHDRPCRYQQTVAKGLAWLLSQENRLTGDIRGRGDMYDQGIGTLALVEAYGVTRDQDVYEAAQSALFFNADAQNEEDGGWRYKPKDPGDLSVSGWVIMGLKSAELSGFRVPAKTRAGAIKWLKNVSSGENGGLFSYQARGQRTPAMQATGFFCSQLMGLPASTPKAFEAVDFVRKSEISLADIYYAYYGTLCSYQGQGPSWREWNRKMQDVFLAAQREDGSWPTGGGLSAQMGPVVATSLITLCLQAHYRYVPLFGLGYEPPDRPVAGAVMTEDDLPSVPEYDRARPMNELNSPADDLYATPTRHGDFIYFASNREGGEGGLDLYRSRSIGVTNSPPVNLGPAINSPADDTAPALRAAGFTLIFSSNRDGGGKGHRLFSSSSRIVFPQYDYSVMPSWSWLWENYPTLLLVMILSTAVLAGWAAMSGWRRKRRRGVS